MSNDPDARLAFEPLVRAFEVQTTYGYYPTGTWGHASFADSLEAAIAIAGQSPCTRIVDPDGAVVWP